MDLFNGIGKKIAQTGQGAVKKTKDFADITKINSQIEAEKRNINDMYAQIGYTYYELFSESPDKNLEEYCIKVDDSIKKIQEHQAQIKSIKGITVCPSCGKDNEGNVPFCTACGYKFEIETTNIPENGSGKTCLNCGRSLQADAVFCTNCGSKI